MEFSPCLEHVKERFEHPEAHSETQSRKGRGKSGVGDEHTHCCIQELDNRLEPTVSHGELYSISCDNL